MIIDTSAIIAVLQDEPERRRFNEMIEAAPRKRLSAATLLELSIVTEVRHGAEGIRELDLYLATAGIETLAVDRAQALLARDAFRRFGKGRHRAALNFGDCFSYALAKSLDEPLLFKGSDFGLTDITLAVAPH
jgi:ribonuclease VapC